MAIVLRAPRPAPPHPQGDTDAPIPLEAKGGATIDDYNGGKVIRPSDYVVQESSRQRYNNPPHINGSCLVMGDAQVPYHDAKFINNVKQVAFAWGVRQCLWVGDMVDLSALSIFITQEAKNLREEVADAQMSLGEMAAGFDRIIWCAGNHEDRASRMLEQFFGVDLLAQLLGLNGVETSNYYYIEIGADWLATHPKNTSVIPGRVASLLAEKYGKNVIAFHGHSTGEAQTRSGKLIGIDAGIVADPLRLEYAQVRQGIYPAMTQGAVLLIEDEGEYYPRLLRPWMHWRIETELGELWKRGKDDKEQGERRGVTTQDHDGGSGDTAADQGAQGTLARWRQKILG